MKSNIHINMEMLNLFYCSAIVVVVCCWWRLSTNIQKMNWKSTKYKFQTEHKYFMIIQRWVSEKNSQIALSIKWNPERHTHTHISKCCLDIFLFFFYSLEDFLSSEGFNAFCFAFEYHKLHTMCEHGTMCKNGMKIKCSFRYRLAFDCFRPLKLTAYTVVDLYWRWIKPLEYSKSRTKRVLVKINDIEKRNETERQPRRKKPGERQQQNIYIRIKGKSHNDINQIKEKRIAFGSLCEWNINDSNRKNKRNRQKFHCGVFSCHHIHVSTLSLCCCSRPRIAKTQDCIVA